MDALCVHAGWRVTEYSGHGYAFWVRCRAEVTCLCGGGLGSEDGFALDARDKEHGKDKDGDAGDGDENSLEPSVDCGEEGQSQNDHRGENHAQEGELQAHDRDGANGDDGDDEGGRSEDSQGEWDEFLGEIHERVSAGESAHHEKEHQAVKVMDVEDVGDENEAEDKNDEHGWD